MSVHLVDPRPLLRFDFGLHHPFKIDRLGLTFELMEAYGLTGKEKGVSLILPREATEEEAGSFHTNDYLEILRLAGSGIWISNLASYGLGTPDNPIFPDVYTWGMLVAGSSIDAAKAILGGGKVAFNIAGGLHHAMPSRASGFCHINDPVLAIQSLRDARRRVAYVDIDAHHGDGVQKAFYASPDVLTISVHQSGYTIFPGSGFVDEIGEGPGRGYSVNIPLLPGAGDRAYGRAFEEVVIPLLRAYAPDVLVTQLGADPLIGDAVADLRLSLHGFEGCVRRIS
ncbi:acetoin utilization protein AcuC, partial [Candidatus Acetothermia bacterium]